MTNPSCAISGEVKEQGEAETLGLARNPRTAKTR